MIEIIPTIITNNPNEVREMLERLEELGPQGTGLISRVQLDILDGVFAQNRTTGLELMQDIETDLLLDVHLMTKEPVLWVERVIRAMSDRVVAQVEMMRDQTEFVGKVTEAGLKVGLAIDLDTPVAALDPTVLNNLDVVLVMSVKAGFGGQGFSEGALEKISQLDEIRARDDTPFRICVDGGITEQTIRKVRKAGADEVAVGTAVYKGGDIGGNIERLKKALGNSE